MADSRLSWQEQGHSHTHHKIRGTSSAYFCGGLFQHLPAGSWPETDPVESRCGPGSAKYADNTSQTQIRILIAAAWFLRQSLQGQSTQKVVVLCGRSINF